MTTHNLTIKELYDILEDDFSNIPTIFERLQENQGLEITFGIPSYMPRKTCFKKDCKVHNGIVDLKRPINILVIFSYYYGEFKININTITDVNIIDRPYIVLINTKAIGDYNDERYPIIKSK